MTSTKELTLSRTTGVIRPPLKWAGGKRWLITYLRPLWEPYQDQRLVEPLCGGLGVALSLLPRRALLNDINPHLINFYRWVQRGLRIEERFFNDARFYYAQRHHFNALICSGGANSKEAACLFYYLNRTGYNGLCRFNRKGLFNVPFGRYKTINYVYDFTEYSEIFKDWLFTSVDFEQLVLDPSDFVYADPPYDVEFTSYAKENFTWHDQVRLAEWLSKHPGPVVLSNQATERIIELYRSLGFRLQFLQAPRMISCTGDRKPALEVLATKNVEAR